MPECRPPSRIPGRSRAVREYSRRKPRRSSAAVCPAQHPGALQKLLTGLSASSGSASPFRLGAPRVLPENRSNRVGARRSSVSSLHSA